MYIKNKYRKNFDKSLLNITKKLVIFYISLLSVSSYAADFIITEGETYNNGQLLEGNEVGVIEAGSTLEVIRAYSFYSSQSALDLTGGGNQFTNDGNFFYHDVNIAGDNNIFTNNGQMTSDGSNETSILTVYGNNNKFINNGNIYHSKDRLYSFSYIDGINNEFINEGIITQENMKWGSILYLSGETANNFVNNGEVYFTNNLHDSRINFAILNSNRGANTSNIFTNNNIIEVLNTKSSAEAFRFRSNSNNNIINNFGKISTYAASGYSSVLGLHVDDNNSTNNIVNNYGTLNASFTDKFSTTTSWAIRIVGNSLSNKTNNYGNIIAEAPLSEAIGIYSDNLHTNTSYTRYSYEVYNEGSITANSDNGEAYGLKGDILADNYGTITANSVTNKAYGVWHESITNSSPQITNRLNGVISASSTDADAYAIHNESSDRTYQINNEGSINANSQNGIAYGIKGDILADNYGTITANSVINNAYGVWHESISNSSPQITNRLNSVISASSTEADAYAIHNESSDLAYQIDNYGTIASNSKNGNAYAISGNAIINNYGIITANSENGAEYAFYSPDNNNTISTGNQISTSSNQSAGHGQIINLYPGSQIVGKMNLSSNDVINLYLESDIALNVTIEGDPEINIVNNNSNIILTDNGFSTNDVDIEDLLRKNLLDSNQQITDIIKQNIIYQRVNNYKDHHLWANLIKYDLEHEKYDNIAAYTNEAYGLVAGVDFEQKKSSQSFFIALLDKHSESDKHSPPFKLDAQLISLGGYFNFSLGNFALTNALTVAYQLNKTERNIIDNINGAEVAKGTFNSIQLTPQVNLAYYHDFYNFTFIPNLNLTYSKEFYESYSETGTSNANRNFGKRDIDYYSLDLALSVNKKILNNKADVQIKVGRQHNYFKADEVEIKYSASTGTGSLPKHNYMSNYFSTAFNYQISKDLDLNLELTHKKKLNSRLNLSLRF